MSNGGVPAVLNFGPPSRRLVASLSPMLAATAIGRMRTPGLEPDLELKGRGGGGERTAGLGRPVGHQTPLLAYGVQW